MRTSMQARHAKTRSYHDVLAPERNPLRFDLFTETFDSQPDAVLFGMCYDQHEFVAADAAA